MGFLKRLLALGRSRPPEPTLSVKQGSSTTSRDYGGTLREQPGASSIITGARLICALDENTCLTCLELDGSETPPQLPMHEGCRCITLPITKTYRQLGLDMDEISAETRSSAIGQVPADGGVYKAYLVERARAHDSGKQGSDLVANLKARLPAIRQAHPGESHDVVAAVEAAILRQDPNATPDDAVLLLRSIRWNASDEMKALLEICIKHGRYDEILSALARMVRQVPTGSYAPRHKGMLFRTAAQVSKRHSLSWAVKYLQQAAELDSENPTVFLELGKLLRRVGRGEEARVSLERALQLNPALKSVKAELEKLR